MLRPSPGTLDLDVASSFILTLEGGEMRYTVKQLADLAGVSTRTLRYYDQIGLLEPAAVGENGYRYYGADEVLRLQQIMFYRELDLPLENIGEILDGPDFDLLQALEEHRASLRDRVGRLRGLIRTIDKTMAHLRGEVEMENEQLFEGFDEETQAKYEEEAAQRWDPDLVRESSRRWKGYSDHERKEILAENERNYRQLAGYIGRDPASTEVQTAVAKWHDGLRHFYEPTPEMLVGLAQLYTEDARFRAFFEQLDHRLPDFLREAIEHYTAEN